MKSHRIRLWFSVACILLILLQSISFLVFFNKQEENSYSQKIELAGSLRKLAQEMIKNVVIYKFTQDSQFTQSMNDNVNEFDDKLSKIMSDKTADYYIEGTSKERLETNLTSLSADWSTMKIVIQKALENQTEDGLNSLLEYQWKLTANTQALVELFVELDKESQRNIARVEMVIILIITIGVVTIWFFLHHYMISSTQRAAEEQNKLLLDTVKSLCKALDAKDPYTYGHSERVAVLSKAIAKEMGYDERKCFLIELSGYLHDIGKLGIPNEVLNKKGSLTEEEYQKIQLHPILGANIVSEVEMLNEVVEGILYHHERFDGLGYPYRLKNFDIPEMARIIALADAYDAMTSNRSYRQAMTHHAAVKIIQENRGTQFDSHIVDHFAKIVHHYHTLKIVNNQSIEEESDSKASAI